MNKQVFMQLIRENKLSAISIIFFSACSITSLIINPDIRYRQLALFMVFIVIDLWILIRQYKKLRNPQKGFHSPD